MRVRSSPPRRTASTGSSRISSISPRIDAHQFSLSPRPFDLATVVRTSVEAFLPAAADLAITLAVEAPTDLPAVGDPERLAQIVANLVENALKYARARIDVLVRTVVGDESGDPCRR